ncbi:MAG TPA: hypothetical protein VGH97_09575 [Thermoanaerobaculia bacterium]
MGGSDSAGYANTARDLVAGRIVVPVEAPARLGLDDGWSRVFIPLAEYPGARAGTMVPYYPPGFPLHVALVSLVAGWTKGPLLVSPLFAIAALVLTYLLARELTLSRAFSLAAGALLAGCSVFIAHAIWPISDIAATTWCTAAILGALRARRTTGWAGWAALSGASFGLAVLIRPADALLLLPLALALPWRRTAWVPFVLAGSPFALFYGFWNQTAYGSPFRTGYAGQLATELSASYFAARAGRYGWWILIQFSPLVPLGWAGMAVDRRVPVRDRALLLSWFASFFVFHCLWMSAAADWTFGRYLLPAAPALLIGFLLALRDALRHLPEGGFLAIGRRVGVPYRAAAATVIVGALLFVERRVERRLRPLRYTSGDAVYPEGCRRLQALAPDGKALVVGMEFSAAVRYYTRLTPVRWDLLSPDAFAVLRARAAANGYRILGAVLPHEANRAASAAPGEWRFIENVGLASLWELPPPGERARP